MSNFTLKQNNFNGEAVRLLFKWMYFNELPSHEWAEMSFKQAQSAMNCALFTKTWEFLIQVVKNIFYFFLQKKRNLFKIFLKFKKKKVIKVIIPKMTSEKLIDFLILSEYLPQYFEGKIKDDNILNNVFKLLQNYCILYFSNNSLDVIENTEDVKIQCKQFFIDYPIML